MSYPPMLTHKLKTTLKRYSMLHPGDHVLVGVSGGADSLALLYALHALRDELSLFLRVAHLNHLLRPEADREASFVQEIARSLDLPFSLGREDVSRYRQEKKLSLEMAARELRYRFFECEAARHGCNKIALGHTADDQAETVLMRLMRGAGPRGLAGIPPIREGRYIRPLIEVSRREVEAFLAGQGRHYILDPSNANLRYLRNKVRLDLIPRLEKEYNPRIRENLVSLADVLRQEDAFLEEHCQGLLAELSQEKTEDGLTLALNIARLWDLPLALRRRVLRAGIQKARGGDLRAVSRRQLEAVLGLLEGKETGRRYHLPGLVVQRGYQELLLFCPKQKEGVRRVPSVQGNETLPVPGLKVVTPLGWAFRTTLIDRKEVDLQAVWLNRWVALLDHRKVPVPLQVRTRAPGDRFHPLGGTGSQKLKQFFIDHHVPREERDRIPLLVSENEVLWIVGMRISDRAKVTDGTQEVLEIVASHFTPKSPGR